MRANPASRLLSLLKDISKQGSSKSSREVWAGVLGVEAEDTHGILVGVASVLQLLDEARDTVQEVVGDQNAGLHMGAFNRLGKTFSTLNLNSNSKQLLEGVNESIQGLKFTVDLVERLDTSGEIDPELLGELISQINEQLEALAASDIPKRAKRVLHDRLVAVREAAEELRLSGLEYLEETLDGLVGAAVRYVDRKKPEQKKWLDGVAKLVDLGVKILSLAEKAPELPAIGRRLLGSGE